MIPTCKEMVAGLEDLIVEVALWSLVGHLLIAIGVPIVRGWINYFRAYMDRNLDDHAKIYQETKKP